MYVFFLEIEDNEIDKEIRRLCPRWNRPSWKSLLYPRELTARSRRKRPGRCSYLGHADLRSHSDIVVTLPLAIR